MYSVKADVLKNRLEITIAGRLTPEQVAKVGEESTAALAKLRPGFVAAIDLSEQGVALPEDIPILHAFQTKLVAAAPGRVGTLATGIVGSQVARVGKDLHADSILRRFTDRDEWKAYVG